MRVMDATTQAAAERANELVGQLIAVNHREATLNAELNARMQAVKQEFGPNFEATRQQRAGLEKELKELLATNFDELVKPGTKTIFLRHGQISKIMGKEKLDVSDDETAIIKRIRRAGGVRLFIRRGKESLDKNALKKAPAFVAKIKGLAIVREESMVIKPSTSQGEIVLTANDVVISPPREN